MNFKYKRLLAIVLIFAFLFTYFVLLRNGPGVTTDSVLYISTAENIVDNNSPTSPLNNNRLSVHYPPLYIYLIAFFKSSFLDILKSIRFFNSLCFAIFAVFVFKVLTYFYDFTSKNIYKMFFVISFSEISILPFMMTWTEVLFIPCIFLSLLSAFYYIRRQKFAFFILCTFFSMISLLNRYAAAPLIIWISLFFLIFPRKINLPKRVLFSGIYFILSIAPTCLWLLSIIKFFDLSYKIKLAIHPLSLSHVRQFVRTILFLFFPNNFLNYIKENLWLQSVFVVIITSIFIVIISSIVKKFKCENLDLKTFFKAHISDNLAIFILLAGFSIFYFIFLFCSISLIDFNTPLDYRISSPGLISLLLSIFILPALLKNRRYDIIFKKYLLNLFFLLVFVRIIFFSINDCGKGFGYNSKTWRESEILKKIDFSNSEVYSNASDGIYFLTGKLTKQIPSKINRNTGFDNPGFYNAFLELITKLKNPQRDIMIIYFNSIPTSGIPMSEEFLSFVKADEVLKTKDAIILYYARKNQNRLD